VGCRPSWDGWFEGHEALFLAQRALPRLVCVSQRQHLSPGLTVAQMQGAFEFRSFRGAGHQLQEDCPGEAATALLLFATSAVARTGGARRVA